MNTHRTRRHFLRSTSACIALPFLESLSFRRFASAAPAALPPKRMIFLAFGWGVTKETWFPDLKQTGTHYTLPSGLAPLARHQKDITVVQGCSNKFSNEAHWGSTFWLTGANRYAQPGQSFCNSVSVDQVAAAQLGKDTRFASLQLGTPDAKDQGHGPGLSLAWDQRGKPVAGIDHPVQVFHRLFSTEDAPLAEREAMLAPPTREAWPFQRRYRQARRIRAEHPRHRDAAQQGRAMAGRAKGQATARRAAREARRPRGGAGHV
jgi:hypothetical protein